MPKSKKNQWENKGFGHIQGNGVDMPKIKGFFWHRNKVFLYMPKVGVGAISWLRNQGNCDNIIMIMSAFYEVNL